MKITFKQLKQIIREEVQRLNENTCPCGIEAADCDYHKSQVTSDSLDVKIKALESYAKKFRLKFIPNPKEFYDEIDFERTVAVAAMDQTHEQPMVCLLDDGTFEACTGEDQSGDIYGIVNSNDVMAGNRVHSDLWD